MYEIWAYLSTFSRFWVFLEARIRILIRIRIKVKDRIRMRIRFKSGRQDPDADPQHCLKVHFLKTHYLNTISFFSSDDCSTWTGRASARRSAARWALTGRVRARGPAGSRSTASPGTWASASSTVPPTTRWDSNLGCEYHQQFLSIGGHGPS